MTETEMEPPPPAPPPPPRRLVRDPDDRVVAGVCAGFARHTDTDPVLWRVTVAVLALLGGAGFALYALGWLLVPRAGDRESVAERALRRPDRSLRVVGVLGAVVVAVLLLGLLDNGAAGALLVLVGIGYLVTRERRGQPLPAAFVATEGPAPAPVTTQARQRSRLGAATASVAAVVLGVLLALRAGGADGLTTPRILAVLLLVLGAGVLIGSWWGRARWLIPVGVVLALLLGATSVVDRSSFDGGVGERSWRAVDGGSYRLSAGEAVLDLRGLRGLDDARVEAHLGLGELVVLVPRGMSVVLNTEIGLGELSAPGIERRDGDRIEEQVVVGSADDATVTVDLTVGLGEVEVRRVAS